MLQRTFAKSGTCSPDWYYDTLYAKNHVTPYLSSRILIEDAKYPELSRQCFARASRRPKQHVMIRVVHRVKYLRLNWVEMREPE